MISLAEYAAMGVKVTVDTKVRKTKGCKTWYQRIKPSNGYVEATKPVGYSQLTYNTI